MIPGLPPISASVGGGGPSGASSNSGVSNPFSIPFVFDNSGWNLMNRSKGDPKASGSSGAASGSPNAGAGTAAGLLAGFPLHYILIGLGVWLILKRV